MKFKAVLAGGFLALSFLAAPASAQPACPSQDFTAFMIEFMESEELQRAFTVQPLEWNSVDAEALPEPAPKTEMLAGDSLKFPLIGNADTQDGEGFKSLMTEIGADREWKLFVPDTGIQVRYLFRKKADGSCWELYKVSDDTI